jgi:RraA family protein
MSTIGNRIFTKISRPDPAIVARFKGVPSSNVGDAMHRIGCMHARIKPYNKTPLLGTAYTVRTRSADNLLLHYAMDHAQPGDVIVIDAQGELNSALLGEHMATWAHSRGLAGIIVDGAIRDQHGIASLAFPVYAAGVQPNGPFKHGPGEINTPISCGNIVVNPGDIVVGDEDGIAVIPQAYAAVIADEVDLHILKEIQTAKEIRDKTWSRSNYTNTAFTALGIQIIDDAYHDAFIPVQST